MIKKIVFFVFIALVSFYFGTKWDQLKYTQTKINNLAGSWVEPIPGTKNEYQGFILYSDKTAKSINMATLIYKSWYLKDGKIFFNIKSIGNHISADSVESYRYEMPSKDRLILTDGAYRVQYKRMGVAH
jgi:hypothetical protein